MGSRQARTGSHGIYTNPLDTPPPPGVMATTTSLGHDRFDTARASARVAGHSPSKVHRWLHEVVLRRIDPRTGLYITAGHWNWRDTAADCDPFLVWAADVVVMKAVREWRGQLVFDIPRHHIFMQLQRDWPPTNALPEWFTVEPDGKYAVRQDRDDDVQRVLTRTGAALHEGLELKLAARQKTRLTVRPADSLDPDNEDLFTSRNSM